MRENSGVDRAIDARYAGWLASSSPATVGYYANCGMSLPDKEETPHGRGPGWQGRALAAVLRECYRRGLSDPTLEEVEISALSVLPEPECEGEGPRHPLAQGARERWEQAVGTTAEIIREVLRHGPASGAAGGSLLFSGGLLGAEVSGLVLEQRVDLLWRRPDGTIEALLIFDEPFGRAGSRRASDDWRRVLAATVVRALSGENPDIHALWISDGVASVEHIPDETLEEKVGLLNQILGKARTFGGPIPTGESVFYQLSPLSGDAEYAQGRGRRRRRRPRRSRP